MLVERDDLAADLVVALDDAIGGRGRLVLVAGEAGVGKSALVRAVAASVHDRVRVRTGGADNVTTAEPFAPFREALPEIEPVLAEATDRVRLLRAIRGAVVAVPGLLILEDLHWADEATFDALRFVGRRLDGVPALILATYRDDEVDARHPLRLLMGELASVPGVTRVRVPPLTTTGVAELAVTAGVTVDPAELHHLTGGNAFFVTELLAVGGEHLPATVGDAVMARVARLPASAQDVASAAAVLGAPADAALLLAISGSDAAAIDLCTSAGVLVADGDTFGYRHELARQAVEASLSAVRRHQLHGRALRALDARTPEDHRTLAHHAAACGDEVAAARHATLAARRAAALGAHREAATHYRLALAHTVSHDDRAALFVALSYECYLTDQLPEAITARQRALELHRLAEAPESVGDDERWLSRLSWFLGRGSDAERYAIRAIQTLEPLAPGPTLAMAYSNLSQLRMLGDDNAEAKEWGEKALALAARFGAVEIEAHALNNLGTVALAEGRVVEGEAQLSRSLDLSLAADLPEHAARAHTNLGSAAVDRRDYVGGAARLDAGIAYCEDRDLDSWARYMRAWRCVVLADGGRLEEALVEASDLLDHPGIAPVSAIPAATAAARSTSRRGEDAAPFLAVATALAEQTGELQRIAPAACAAAEDAWLRADLAAIAPLTEPAWVLAREHDDAAALGELAWWRMLAGVAPPADLPALHPFDAMLAGQWLEAAEAWERMGSPVWAAYARGRAEDAASADHAARVLDGCGAVAAVRALLRDRRDLGLPLPRRPRAAARAHGGLTTREFEVLTLLAEGLSTAEIADALVLSPRTAEHHVSAVLRKLGEPTRARAVATARRTGILSAD